MKRRNFLQLTGLMGAGLVLGNLPLRCLATPLAGLGNEERVLVIIQLEGGNDGLNTYIPIDNYSTFRTLRPFVSIPEASLTAGSNRLNGVSDAVLHPKMTGMRNLFNDGKLRIVQNIGYANQDYSHFRSTDIWLTGANANEQLYNGWTGRYLDTVYTGFPTGYPNANFPDPPAIQIGYVATPAFQGINTVMGMTISDPENFYNLLSDTAEPTPNSYYGQELAYIRRVANQTNEYANTIKAAAGRVTVGTGYPANNYLADQLQIVARLIHGGLKTQVYWVSLGGFDTHAAQVLPNDSSRIDHTINGHARLIWMLSEAIAAFQADLKAKSLEDRVVGMTFSEFGRRIRDNASNGGGTDHGAAAPHFFFGTQVIPGVLGQNPVLNTAMTVEDNLPFVYDFRQVYASLLHDWLGVSKDNLRTILGGDYPIIPIIKPSAIVGRSPELTQPIISRFLAAVPNPASDTTVLSFELLEAGMLTFELLNAQGQLLYIINRDNYLPGKHHITVQVRELPAGSYYCRMRNSYGSSMQRILVIR